jgi:hypothetical protein
MSGMMDVLSLNQPAIALPKPFSANQLLEMVAAALRRAGCGPAHTEVSFQTAP